MTNFVIEWTTDIIDVAGAFPVAGYLILAAPDITIARSFAEDQLTDVDFFMPGRNLSASSPAVLRGEVWRIPGGRPGRDLGEVLPDVDEWNFDDIKVTDVREVVDA